MSQTHQGHRARKRFGQNFLHDQGIINAIVDAIHPQSDENLVEIGPGLGALTEVVCERVEQLTVVELDRDLAARLQSHPFIGNKLQLVQADALKFDFATLAEPDRKLRVFGNLPYNISTPLLFHLFKFAAQVQDMCFMLQKEVVDRLAAGPNSKTYGKLSVMAQYHCQIQPLLSVPPSAFKPAPKVESAVVRLVPHAQPPAQVNDPKTLENLCALAFNQRRKTLRNSLKNICDDAIFTQADVRPEARAENLSLDDFARLSNLIESPTP